MKDHRGAIVVDINVQVSQPQLGVVKLGGVLLERLDVQAPIANRIEAPDDLRAKTCFATHPTGSRT